MYWDEQTCEIKWCTMWEYTVSLALGRSAWFVGPAGLGKSTLQAVWARFWCRSCLKPSYLYGKAIDPIGVLSRDGKLDCVGALCLADFNFKTQANSILDHEDLLSLCGVFEPGAISARYGCAQFPQGMRRVFSVNMGKYQWTQKNDPGAFFETHSCMPFAHLARKDEPKLKEMDDMQSALARRSVIFVLPADLDLRIDTVAMDDEHAAVLVQEQLNRDQCC